MRLVWLAVGLVGLVGAVGLGAIATGQTELELPAATGGAAVALLAVGVAIDVAALAVVVHRAHRRQALRAKAQPAPDAAAGPQT